MPMCRRPSFWALLLVLAAASLAPTAANAQAPLVTGLGGAADFGESSLVRNDDGSSALISLSAAFPAGLRFYGSLYTGLYLNNNGNVSFAGPISTFTPDPFPVAARPMIAPWWGDVDTRNTSLTPATRNLVYWDIQPGTFTATWYDVGYFANAVDLLNSFQLIITDASSFGVAGSFDVEFRYNRCQWTTGSASGGVGGLGGTPAQAGFDAGDDTNYLTLPGSRTMAILDVCTTSNVGETGVWRFQVRPGGVTVCGNSIRELGEDCDDGNVADGDGCNSRCARESPPGTPCTEDIQCASGFCTDGVCCGSRCFGQCEACNELGAAGVCLPVGGAPRGTRASCPAAGTACGGSCNGSDRTSCAFPGAATSCDDGAFCTTSDVCNGAGGCSGSARLCDDGVTCTSDSCDESLNRCATAPRPAGTTCNDGAACTTRDACDAAGRCAGVAVTCPDDGLACTAQLCSPTTGTCGSTVTTGCLIGGACIADGALDPSNPCRSCNPTVSRTSYTATPSGTRCSEPFCAAGEVTPAGACDGAGMCVVGPATPCRSGECDGPATCRGPCTSDAECTRPTYCDGALGRCVPDLPRGETCGRAAMCLTDLCIDGVCCDGRCAGECESCSLAGTLGRCSPYASGTDPEGECAGMLMCDGTGKCELEMIDAGPATPDAGPGEPDAALVEDDASVPEVDASVPPGVDAGPRPDAAPGDAGGVAQDDAGPMDAGLVAGGLTGGACSCAAPGGSPSAPRAVWALLGLGLFVAARRASRTKRSAR